MQEQGAIRLFEDFTREARGVLDQAVQIAVLREHDAINTEDLLFAVAHSEGEAAEVLRQVGFAWDPTVEPPPRLRTADEFEASSTDGYRKIIRYSGEATEALQRADDLHTRYNTPAVTDRLLLFALIADDHSVASRRLTDDGVDCGSLRRALVPPHAPS